MFYGDFFHFRCGIMCQQDCWGSVKSVVPPSCAVTSDVALLWRRRLPLWVLWRRRLFPSVPWRRPADAPVSVVTSAVAAVSPVTSAVSGLKSAVACVIPVWCRQWLHSSQRCTGTVCAHENECCCILYIYMRIINFDLCIVYHSYVFYFNGNYQR